jgi:hypothetical protein
MSIKLFKTLKYRQGKVCALKWYYNPSRGLIGVNLLIKSTVRLGHLTPTLLRKAMPQVINLNPKYYAFYLPALWKKHRLRLGLKNRQVGESGFLMIVPIYAKVSNNF